MNISFGLVRDFYYLEALSAKMSQDPDQFNHTKARLIERTNSLHDDLAATLARVFRDYLFLTCMGEARHANHKAISCIPEIPAVKSRTVIYAMSSDYAPSKHNWGILTELFKNNKWESGFGGKSWGHIAEFGAQYGEVSNSFYVDHVVDLEHNNGNVFNKFDAMEYVGLDSNLDTSALKSFLDLKFQYDLLEGPRNRAYAFIKLAKMMTSTTINLIRRYFFVFEGIDIGEWVCNKNSRMPAYGWYKAEFGDQEFSDLEESEGMVCASCGCRIFGDNYQVQGDDYYCLGCSQPTCDRCGHYCEDVYPVLTNYQTVYYCRHCLEEKATKCPNCGDHVKTSHMSEHDGTDYCPYCYRRIVEAEEGAKIWA